MVKIIIPASGSGSRFGGSVPKQFVKLDGKEVIAHTIAKFNSLKIVDEIIISTKEQYGRKIKSIVEKNRFLKVKKIVTGGEYRQDSVYNALVSCECKDNDIVLVHDAVRPFISKKKIKEIIDQTRIHQSIIPAIKVNETIKEVSMEQTVEKTIDRRKLWLAQTPQGFIFKILMRSYEEALRDSFRGTDESCIAEHAGFEVKIVEGEMWNMKITTKEDMEFAKKYLRSLLDN